VRRAGQVGDLSATSAKAALESPLSMSLTVPSSTFPAASCGSVSGRLSTAAPSTVTVAVSLRTDTPARWVCPGWNAVDGTFFSPLRSLSSSSAILISFGQRETR
jgi:hypothetical protein